jgi:hypothetical protein
LLGTKSGGLNAGFFLNASTVHDDGQANVLEGGGHRDWFFEGAKDKVKHHHHNEIITKVTAGGGGGGQT